jgi:hypothetical protein
MITRGGSAASPTDFTGYAYRPGGSVAWPIAAGGRAQ